MTDIEKLLASKKWKAARARIQDELVASPSDHWLWMHLGLTYGEGMDWALQLVNDVHYRMGRYFEHKGRETLARASYEKYLHNRAHGVGSIYDDAPIKKRLADQKLTAV